MCATRLRSHSIARLKPAISHETAMPTTVAKSASVGSLEQRAGVLDVLVVELQQLYVAAFV